jgi:hypothetical protein
VSNKQGLIQGRMDAMIENAAQRLTQALSDEQAACGFTSSQLDLGRHGVNNLEQLHFLELIGGNEWHGISWVFQF